MRVAESRDVHAMQALLAQLYAEEGADYVQDAPALHDALFSTTTPMRLRAFVAEQNGTMIGTVIYYAGYDVSSASLGFHLADIIVHRDYRRRGLGRLLFAQMAAQGLSEKAVWISLTVLRKNAAARAFYRSLGFTKATVDFYHIGASKMMVHTSDAVRCSVDVNRR
jgi:ribosomal protein S18 acetylase RimI-like enzyme